MFPESAIISHTVPSYERDIFLSHRSTDKPWTRELARRIESVYVDGRQLTAWLDEAEVRPGKSVVAEINRGLERSRYIALIMTPDYFDSPSGWTDAEWQAALYTDPAGRQGRLIPLLVKDCPYIPILLRHLGMLDFREPREYERSLIKLLTLLKGEPQVAPRIVRGQIITATGHLSGETLAAERPALEGKPDTVSESLACNLLPAIRLPEFVWSGSIAEHLFKKHGARRTQPTKEEVKVRLRAVQDQQGVEKPTIPAFILHEGRLFTFHDLEREESLLFEVVETGEIKRELAGDWESDPDRRRLLVRLLNMAVDRHCHRVGLIKDPEKPRFFFPPNKGEDRTYSWRRGARPRTVTKRCVRADGSVFWRHIAARLPLFYLGQRFYLHITNTWLFTQDGTNDTILRGPDVTPLAFAWTGKERNLQVLYHTRFWAHVLARGASVVKIRTGDQELYLDTRPAFIRLPFGVTHDRANLEELLYRFTDAADEVDLGEVPLPSSLDAEEADTEERDQEKEPRDSREAE
jgi:hypothetical protein